MATWIVIAISGYSANEGDQGTRVWSHEFKSQKAAEEAKRFVNQREDVSTTIIFDEDVTL